MPNSIKCVLFIDDDKATNYINQFLAKRSNFFEEILIASSGKEGLDCIQQANEGSIMPEIIFLDINMPAMNGWDFLNSLSEMVSPIKKNIKIYMLTSSSRKKDIDRAKEYPEVKGFLTKPLTNESLENLINNKNAFALN